jgi:hypothetical protein
MAGTSVLGEDGATEFVAAVVKAFNIGASEKVLRDELDRTVKEFARLCTTSATKPVAPVEPVKPTTPNYSSGKDQWHNFEMDGGANVIAPEWSAYDENMRKFREESKDYAKQLDTFNSGASSVGAKIRELQSRADAITKQLEAKSEAHTKTTPQPKPFQTGCLHKAAPLRWWGRTKSPQGLWSHVFT